MSLVRYRNKKTGVTYVYESTSYWDKEKKQPRNKRKLIGRLDPATGEIVPTGSPGRRKKAPLEEDGPGVSSGSGGDVERLKTEIESRDSEILSLKNRIGLLERQLESSNRTLDRIHALSERGEDGF